MCGSLRCWLGPRLPAKEGIYMGWGAWNFACKKGEYVFFSVGVGTSIPIGRCRLCTVMRAMVLIFPSFIILVFKMHAWYKYL